MEKDALKKETEQFELDVEVRKEVCAVWGEDVRA